MVNKYLIEVIVHSAVLAIVISYLAYLFLINGDASLYENRKINAISLNCTKDEKLQLMLKDHTLTSTFSVDNCRETILKLSGDQLTIWQKNLNSASFQGVYSNDYVYSIDRFVKTLREIALYSAIAFFIFVSFIIYRAYKKYRLNED